VSEPTKFYSYVKYFSIVASLDGSVGIATSCGLDERGLTSGRGKAFFSTLQQPHSSEVQKPLIQLVRRGYFHRGKAAGA
jgi:hypothetical protein